MNMIYNEFKDAFDHEIVIGSKVLIMDCWSDGSFCGFIKGEVTGFTNEFVKITPLKFDKRDSCSDFGRTEWIRKPHRVVVL